MKTIIVIFIFLLVIAIGGKLFLTYYPRSGSLPTLSSFLPGKTATVKINNKEFIVYLATTAKTREIGLSEKKSIPENSGMLFEFDNYEFLTFWMKDMKFPIDILFIKDNKIVTIYNNVQNPKSLSENLTLYKPTEVANKVLEINSGLSEKYNIKVGDIVVITK